jgi:hypothetical protein
VVPPDGVYRSVWIANVYRDRALAAQVLAHEKEYETAAAPGPGIATALVKLISDCYFLAGELGIECPPAIVSVPA